MRWIKPNLRSSLFALLGGVAPPTDAVQSTRVARIRQSMRDCLGDAGAIRFPQLTRKISFADDPLALWYARSDLMGALCALHGEAVARAHLGHLTLLFEGLVPKSMTARIPEPKGCAPSQPAELAED